LSGFQQLRDCYSRRDEFARESSAAGGKVVAYMCDNFPHELVTAAGMFPFRLRGDPAAPTPHVDRYVVPDRPPMIDVPAFVDAMLEPLVAGRHEFVDYVVIPHGRKAIESSYESLIRARAGGAPIHRVELFYLDKSWVPGAAARAFDRQSLLALKAQLELWAGVSITDDALTAALADAQRGRALLARLNRLRLEHPPRVSGSDALLVYALASAMAPAQLGALLDGLLADASGSAARPGPRICLGGSTQPSTTFYELVESCGATIVGEDHCWGERTAGCGVPDGLSPLEGLASRYHDTPACSIEFPLDHALARWRASVRLARPDGVLLCVAPGDELHVWDTPDKMALLAADGIPSLHLGPDAYGTSEAQLTQTIRTWLDGLRR
jgi:benzoyl-CoA reductase/2-hydroxyglutaryl-CoA dehydratase subunit BcrC/BadD/HgdB